MKLPKNLLLSSLLAATLLHATPDCQQTYKVQSFAQRFYVEVLDRQPDNAGLDSWTNDLTSRTKTGADVASGFIFSQEFINKDTNDDAFVTTLYKAFFNREASADPDGFAYWKGKLTEDVSREEVSNGFIYSVEFANLSAEYGIQAYEGATFTTTALDNFVKRFYTVILGRDADAGGLKSWTDQLSTGTGTGADIAKGFIFSAEYNLDSKSNTQYINDLYAAFFNRTADQAGFDGWIAELTSGTPREEVLDNFLHSQEFINLTNSFGILAFEGAPTPDASDNVSPVADAGDDVTLDAQTSFSLSASQSRDDDGTLSCYWWSEGSTLLGETATLTPTGLSVGTHTLRLTVVDDAGVSNSDSVNVDITAIPTSITHNGTTYGFVTSPYTGKVWLDRNLGAARVCESFNDTACYGDYYQWGRNFDGHQDSTSSTTGTLATDVNNIGSSFITSSSSPWDWTTVDSNGSKRQINWSKTDGSSVCPIGFRVPTIEELREELFDAGFVQIQNRDDAFNNFLKLPSAGSRTHISGDLVGQGSLGNVWANSPSGYLQNTRYVPFGSDYVYAYSSSARTYGYSVRCLRD